MTTTTRRDDTDFRHWSRVRKACAAVGAVFLLVGLAGFVPGLTQDLDTIEFAGHESGAELLGLFQVSVLHNLVHLAFGLAGLIAAKAGADVARNFLVIGGVIYLALWLYGLLVDETSDANFVPLNTADNWLHFGLGVGMIVLGLALPERHHLTGTRDAEPNRA
jgi:hypothetical protein